MSHDYRSPWNGGGLSPYGFRPDTFARESARCTPADVDRLPPFRVTRGVFEQIQRHIGFSRAENGGMLGGDRAEGVVRHFHFDRTGSRSAVTYSPDHQMLTQLLSEQWNPQDIQLMGFVHSHPGTFAQPSGGDRYYAARILEANPRMDRLLMPIVMTIPDAGRFELVPFAAVLSRGDLEVIRMTLEILPESTPVRIGEGEPSAAVTGSRWTDRGVGRDDFRRHDGHGRGFDSHSESDHESTRQMYFEIDHESNRESTHESAHESAHESDRELTHEVDRAIDPRERPMVSGASETEVRPQPVAATAEPSEQATPPLPRWLDPQFPLRIAPGSSPPNRKVRAKLQKRYEHANRCQWTSTREMFRRVITAYDLPHLARCRVVYVGVGGAAAFAEELVRAGVGEHVLIDDDVVSESNLATQQTYRWDLNQPKVEALKRRLLSINPNARIETRQRRLDDAMSDDEFRQLALGPLRDQVVYSTRARKRIDVEPLHPVVTLLCGLTDQFEPQARVNRLALNLGLPSLCAQVYQAGRGAEVTFTHPEVTPACHRCVLGGRYREYLENGFQNDVTSDGTPIFSTTRLNALKGNIALALLHHGTDHPRWGSLLRRIGNRNLLQIRIDPDLPLGVFERVFGAGDQQRIFADDVVWLPQEPEGPETGFPTCPECRATGDLRDAIGSFKDTRPMPRGKAREA